jgi:hypothetical protein
MPNLNVPQNGGNMTIRNERLKRLEKEFDTLLFVGAISYGLVAFFFDFSKHIILHFGIFVSFSLVAYLHSRRRLKLISIELLKKNEKENNQNASVN